MERWEWQVQEAVYGCAGIWLRRRGRRRNTAAEQGKVEEAVAKLRRLQLLFRKTGHVAGEIVATGYWGLVLASVGSNEAARQLLVRAVYLAQEQQQEEEVAAPVVDLCALQLSQIVLYPVKPDDEGHEEAVGWFRLQRAPGMALPRFRLLQVSNLLGTRTHLKRRVGFIIRKARRQLQEAAREVMIASMSMQLWQQDEGLVPDILRACERVAEEAVRADQLSQAVDIYRDALTLGSRAGWEEVMCYRLGRLLVKLGGSGGDNFAEALAMFSNSLRCAVDDGSRGFGRDEDGEDDWRLRRANSFWWARLLIQVLRGCPPQHFAEAAGCSVRIELVGSGLSPMSRSQIRECLVDAAQVLIFFPQWQALVIGHMGAVRAELRELAPHSGSTSSGGAEGVLLFRSTKALAIACTGGVGDHHNAARHFLHCRDMAPELHERLRCQLSAAQALMNAGEVEAGESHVLDVLSQISQQPADAWPAPKIHAGLLATAGGLLQCCGRQDSAVVTFAQLWDVCTTPGHGRGCSLDFITNKTGDSSSDGHQARTEDVFTEDGFLENSIERALLELLKEYMSRGEEAAAATELDAALDWYHKASEVAGVFPPNLVEAMTVLCYRIGELQFQGGALWESLDMLANSLRHVLLPIIGSLQLVSSSSDHGRGERISLRYAGPGHVTTVCHLVDRVLALGSGREPDLDSITSQAGAPGVGDCKIPFFHVQLRLGRALCELSNTEGIQWLEAVRADALLQLGSASRRGGEDSILYQLEKYLAWAYSVISHDSSKAAQLYDLCKDMATRLANRLSMQLSAANEWKEAGDLLSAEEAALEALEFLVLEPASAAEGILWPAAAADSSWEVRGALLAKAADALGRRANAHPKIKVALEALWELYRSPANNFDFKNERIVHGLILLVNTYQNNEEWPAAAGLLTVLAPRMTELYQETRFWNVFQACNARMQDHSRHYLQAAVACKDLSSAFSLEDPDMTIFEVLVQSARAYDDAGQHLSAERQLTVLERMIQAKTSWPPGDRDHKQHYQYELCFVRAMVAQSTRKSEQAAIWCQKAASIQEAIIMQQQIAMPDRSPDPVNVKQLAFSLVGDAHLHAELREDDVDGLETKIERIEKLGAGALCGLLRARLLYGRGDLVGAVELVRKEFLRMAVGQQGRGDDDSWIREYHRGLARLVDLLERIYLPQPCKALLWAERGRMRLFMHRVHQQEELAWLDSRPANFDRDDDKAMDMLLAVLLACGPNVALLEYSFSEVDQRQKLRIYLLNCYPVAGHPGMITCDVQVQDCRGIEQLVKKTRDSIVQPLKGGDKNRQAQQELQKKHLAQLHSLLVAPVLAGLHPECETLIFVPQGCLSLVPFAALYDEKAAQFLIQQKQVVVAPCLRALYRCLDLQDRFFRTTQEQQLEAPFVAGNPCPMGLGLRQLPHADEEAAAVAEILGVKPCLGAGMTKEAVVQGLCRSSVVLLATHAIASSKFPAGALVLQGPRTGDMASTSSAPNYNVPLLMRGLLGAMASVTEKYQVLTADELSSMRIRAGLVVLSACETGRGEVTSEGLLGLGRALLQAGAASTVLSLWKVDDKATKHLITEMFQELQKGEPVGTALRKAMLKMIQDFGSSIRDWAPFFVFGSPTMDLRDVTTLKGKKRKGTGTPKLAFGHDPGRTSWSAIKEATMVLHEIPDPRIPELLPKQASSLRLFR